jgi:hypothetical protein
VSGAVGGSAAPVDTKWIGPLNGVGEAFRASAPFVLAGVGWQGPPAARIELRARRASGRWTPWLNASILGHDSDRGETIAHGLVGEPIWTGPADALQLRSTAAVTAISVHLVLLTAVAHSAGAEAAAALPLATPHLPAGPGQPPIIARQAWAHRLLPRAAPYYGDVQMAFVHHSVNGNGYSMAEVPAMLRSIYIFHTYARGWNDFGYNFAVDAYGRVWEGRAGGIDRPVTGAQAGGYNSQSFGVVLLGDFAATLPTAAARRSLAHLIAWKLALHGVPATGRVTVEVDPPDAHYTRYRPGQRVSLPRVAAHRDGCTTDCPGYDMYVSGMPPLRRSVAQLVGTQHALTLAPGRPPGAARRLEPYAIAPGSRAKPATHLELQTVTVTVEDQLPLHGFLRSLAGRPRPGAQITLQKLSSSRHEDSETELASATTTHDGLWFTLLAPRINMLLRALHADAPATASALLILAVRPALTLTVTPDGRGVQVAGIVVPPKPRIEIEVIPAAGTRRSTRRVNVEAGGGYFEARLHLGPGRYWLSAHTPADATNVAGSSTPVAVDI